MSQEIILAGPIGIGHQMTVPHYAPEDGGCWCSRYERTCVWDAAIVACKLSPEWAVTLVGNDIGSNSESDEVRNHLSSKGVNVRELGSSWTGPNFDVVILSEEKSSRTWYSTIRPPAIDEVMFSVAEALEDGKAGVVYFDHWTGSEVSKDLVKGLRDLRVNKIFYNLGDCSSLAPVRAMSRALLGTQVFFQVSLKAPGELDLAVASDEDPGVSGEHAIIVTRGGESAYLFSHNEVGEIPVKRLSHVSTVGAGAYLSAQLLQCLRVSTLESFADVYAISREACGIVTAGLESGSLRSHVL